jgi:TolA-binding protein
MAYYNAQKVGEATGVFRAAIQRDPEDRRALDMFEMLTDVPSI